MTNKEYYKERILDLACEGVAIAINKQTNELCSCKDIGCVVCLFSNNTGTNCNEVFKKWLKSEYLEPCPFKNGELVEVSDAGIHWLLRYFSNFSTAVGAERRYATYLAGAKSGGTTHWRYCRKYGSLGNIGESECIDRFVDYLYKEHHIDLSEYVDWYLKSKEKEEKDNG